MCSQNFNECGQNSRECGQNFGECDHNSRECGQNSRGCDQNSRGCGQNFRGVAMVPETISEKLAPMGFGPALLTKKYSMSTVSMEELVTTLANELKLDQISGHVTCVYNKKWMASRCSGNR